MEALPEPLAARMRTFVTMSFEHGIGAIIVQPAQSLFRPKHYRSELPSHVTFRTGRAGPWPFSRRRRRRRGWHHAMAGQRRFQTRLIHLRVGKAHFAYTGSSRLAWGDAHAEIKEPIPPTGRPGPFLRKRNHATD